MYTIEEVQKIFSAAYPFLKIEFFRNGHGRQQHSYKKDMLSNHTRLGGMPAGILGKVILSYRIP